MRGNGPSENRQRQAVGSKSQEQKCDAGGNPGKLTVIGLGPGGPEYLAPAAKSALLRSDAIAGYKTYIDLIDPDVLEGKEVISSGMRGEIRRCKMAIKSVLDGKNTAVVSSGDSGIYGMAGLVLELLGKQGFLDRVEVEVIPGISALSAAAAILGAPLMHDFAVISLSDLMTPWEVIRQRVEAAAKADFVLVLYNPRSGKRTRQLKEARELMLRYRDRHTPVGIVRNASRKGGTSHITTLSRMDEFSIDMLSIVLVGNSRTCVMDNRMVTPRGYMEKYGEP